MDAYSPIEPLEWHHFLLVSIVPFVPMDHWNSPLPSQTTWENNLSHLNEMHIHQWNHWNRVLFHWYQNGPLELPCTQPHHMRKESKVPLMRCILTNRTIGIECFSIGTNRTIGTNGPLELPCTQPGHMGK